MDKFGKSLYYLVNENDESNRLSKWFNYFLMSLIILSVIEMALETDHEIFDPYSDYFLGFDFFSVMVFSAEYVIRIMTAHLADKEYITHRSRWKSIRRYIFSFAGIVDLLSILPFYLNFMSLDLRVLRILRLFRFLRVFKFARYNNSIKLIGEVIRDKRSELGVIMGLIIMIMIIASFIMYYAEHGVQKEAFSNVFGCFWWAIVTMTTIGYGDVFPVTYLGKIVGGVMALLGIGLVAMPTGIISAGFLEKVNEKYDKEKEEDKKHYCPYCGHKLDD